MTTAAALTAATPVREPHHPGPAAFIVLAVIVAPLVVRRIWPIQVFGWILATGIPAALWDKHLIAWPALLIALYTVAALRSRQAALVCAGLLEIATVVGLALFGGNTVPGWWFQAISIHRHDRRRAWAGPVLRHPARLPRRTARPR